MCGLAGFYEFSGEAVSLPLIEEMTRRLSHRGPDDHGHVAFTREGQAHTWQSERPALTTANVALGSRRLKIIDLSPAGHQPMTTHDGMLWLAYNGEVYNYVELRAELEALGHTFRSHADSEVVLEAYRRWGIDAFARMNGMWGLAIYDMRDRSLTLSRDRWGVKPLYVYTDRDRVVFGSEIKALLAHPAVPRRPNYATIYNYVSRHYRVVDGTPDTFFDAIENLPPAHAWRIEADGRRTERCYWKLDPDRDWQPPSDQAALDEFRRIFDDAVRIRLRSDVPVACMLSGGLDSSSVTCVAAKVSNDVVTTFSARYDEPEFDEGQYVNATIETIGADGRHIFPRPAQLIETLDRMLALHDEPVCTVTWFAHWLVMREVADRGFPVLLNGHVGDELFAGYWDHYMYNLLDLEQHDPVRFRQEFAAWQENHGRDPGELGRLKARLDALASGALDPADQFAAYRSAASPDLQAAARPVERPNPFARHGYLTSRLFLELQYETVPATLRPEDRNSMAFSIETRSPFLDYRLVEFAFGLPNQFKIRHGLGKWIIREGMKGVLPEVVRARRDKQGFNAPTVHWFRGENRQEVRDLLASSELRHHGVLDSTAVLGLFDEHATGAANHYMAIWQWLNVELWMRRTFDARPVALAS